LAAKTAKPPTRCRTALADDWCPPPEVRQLAIGAGYDPAEIVEEMADRARSTGARSAGWPATVRNWIRRERKLHRSQAKRDRRQETEDFIARQTAILRQSGFLPPDGVLAGFAS
jgi:hypothetical protein